MLVALWLRRRLDEDVLRRIVPARVLLVYGKLCVLELDVDPEKTLKQQLYELRREANRRLSVREGVFRREFVVLR